MMKFIKIIPALMLFFINSSEPSMAQERILFEKDRPAIYGSELEKYFQDLSSVLKKESNNTTVNEKAGFENFPGDLDIKSYAPEPSGNILLDSENTKEAVYQKYGSLEKYIKGNTLLESAFMQLDKPYQWGKMGPDGFDCSGFTQYVFKISGITIPRTSEQQSKEGESIDKAHIEPGDLIFFDTRNISDKQDITDQPYLLQYNDPNTPKSGSDDEGLTSLLNVMISANSSSNILVSKPFVPEKVTHVGIYIGDNKFIHASSGGQKVIVSDITSNYYKTRLLNVKRYN